jgi:protein involved in polysaccharide export with SLBB domain
VYAKREVQYRPERRVSVYGSVQQPGEFPYSENMSVKDLLFAAGGVKPGYHNEAELVRAKSDKMQIEMIDLARLMDGDESQNLKLQRQDVLLIRTESEFFQNPILVTVSGEVQYPGVYALSSRSDRLTDILKRAGGVTAIGYLKGTALRRDKSFAPLTEIKTDLDLVNRMFDRINELEYERQVARNRYLYDREQTDESTGVISQSAAATIAASDKATNEQAAKAMLAPGITSAAGKTVESTFEAFQEKSSVVSAARQLGEEELEPADRIVIRIEKAIANPGSDDDLVLMNGDQVFVPRRPYTVSIIGAVTRPTVVTFSNLTKTQYINMAGGYTEDANADKAMIFRMDGSLLSFQETKTIEPGDIIYIPSKPMTLEITTTVDKIIDAVKFSLVTLSSLWVLLAILAL